MEIRNCLVEVDRRERYVYLRSLSEDETDFEYVGEIDGFVPLPDNSRDLPPGTTSTQVVKLDIHTNGTDSKLFSSLTIIPMH